jgi:hypothetical protein
MRGIPEPLLCMCLATIEKKFRYFGQIMALVTNTLHVFVMLFEQYLSLNQNLKFQRICAYRPERGIQTPAHGGDGT